MPPPKDAARSSALSAGWFEALSAEEADHRRRLESAIGADFELGEVIGRGGFGAVYRARDRRLDRPVAIKALRHDLFPSAARAARGYSLMRIARFAVGQPLWWQTWYPRALRVPDSVWARLPAWSKVLRTLIWLQLILLPAGGVLVKFVIPTFRSLSRNWGVPMPGVLPGLEMTVLAAARLLPVTGAMPVFQARQARLRYGAPLTAFLGSLFDLRGSYWQASPMRAILKD